MPLMYALGHALPSVYADLLRLEQWHPEVAAFLLLVFGLYLYAVGPLARRRGWTGRTERRHIVCFGLAMATVYLAEGTPLHALSEQYLFSAHMLQHVLLTFLMPPLLLVGIPAWTLQPLLSRPLVRRLARFFTLPLIALISFNLVNALWHLPELYQAALYHHNVHYWEHVSMVGTALLMWWPVLSPLPELPRLTTAGQLFYLFLMLVAQLPVFGYVAFSHEVIYPFYAEAPRLLSLSPHEDQQLSGIVMKLFTMAVALVVMGMAFFRWAAQEDRQAREMVAAPELGRRGVR